MNIIAFDIEATEADEILELSIISYPDMTELYHSYFAPPVSKRWPKTVGVHNITQEMVGGAPTFNEERDKISAIINSADIFVGHAISNDFNFLKINGVDIPANPRVIDTQQYFALLNENNPDIAHSSNLSLGKVAEIMGCPFTDDVQAHDSRNDTIVTIKVLNALIKKFCDKEPSIDSLIQLEDQYNLLDAKGFIRLVSKGRYFKIKNTRHQPDDRELFIAVESRFRAERLLHEQFREKMEKPGKYNLDKSDIEFFKNFTTEYNPTEEQKSRNFSYKSMIEEEIAKNNSGNQSSGYSLGDKFGDLFSKIVK